MRQNLLIAKITKKQGIFSRKPPKNAPKSMIFLFYPFSAKNFKAYASKIDLNKNHKKQGIFSRKPAKNAQKSNFSVCYKILKISSFPKLPNLFHKNEPPTVAHFSYLILLTFPHIVCCATCPAPFKIAVLYQVC